MKLASKKVPSGSREAFVFAIWLAGFERILAAANPETGMNLLEHLRTLIDEKLQWAPRRCYVGNSGYIVYALAGVTGKKREVIRATTALAEICIVTEAWALGLSKRGFPPLKGYNGVLFGTVEFGQVADNIEERSPTFAGLLVDEVIKIAKLGNKYQYRGVTDGRYREFISAQGLEWQNLEEFNGREIIGILKDKE